MEEQRSKQKVSLLARMPAASPRLRFPILVTALCRESLDETCYQTGNIPCRFAETTFQQIEFAKARLMRICDPSIEPKVRGRQ